MNVNLTKIQKSKTSFFIIRVRCAALAIGYVNKQDPDCVNCEFPHGLTIGTGFRGQRPQWDSGVMYPHQLLMEQDS